MARIIAEDYRDHRTEVAVWTAALVIAVVSARPFATGANDGSRLATVECLVDYHTLAIDRSIFVHVPPPDSNVPGPYWPLDAYRQGGTGDKLWIDGHFYSDKSPVPALFMAGLYQAWQWTTGWTARTHPDRFCYTLTLGSSGLAYVVAVGGIYRLGRRLRLSRHLQLGLTASFALGTLALPYVRQVNSHVLLLAVAVALLPGLARLAEEPQAQPWWRLVWLGTLTGLGYTIDLGTGPLLLCCTAAVVAYRCRRGTSLAAFALAALPWLALHHAVNYAIGGTFKPANAVPEYFQWPGSGFNAHNLTGLYNHPSVGACVVYVLGLLVGKHGFLNHNLSLFLAVVGLGVMVWRHREHRPELLAGACWAGGTWLVYALASINYAGVCCSIRWFVPLLAPAYYVLALLLRRYPRCELDFLILSGWGTAAGLLMWHQGPWLSHNVSFLWVVQLAGLVHWGLYLLWRWRRRQGRWGFMDRPEHRATAA
jgi:hypothetical protein